MSFFSFESTFSFSRFFSKLHLPISAFPNSLPPLPSPLPFFSLRFSPLPSPSPKSYVKLNRMFLLVLVAVRWVLSSDCSVAVSLVYEFSSFVVVLLLLFDLLEFLSCSVFVAVMGVFVWSCLNVVELLLGSVWMMLVLFLWLCVSPFWFLGLSCFSCWFLWFCVRLFYRVQSWVSLCCLSWVYVAWTTVYFSCFAAFLFGRMAVSIRLSRLAGFGSCEF